MPFDIDLAFGEEMEREIGTFLANGRPIEFSTGYFKEWDYKIDGKTYEQKTDLKAQFTGNICVELLEHGNPSGILTSTADYWVSYPIGLNEIAVLPRLQMAKICKHDHCRNVMCGDGMVGQCILVPWCLIPKKYKIPYSKCLL